MVPVCSFFFGGYPRRGGGDEKKFAKFFSRPQTLKFPLYPTSLGLEGARRIFKVTIDVSADMGGICVSGHKDHRPGLFRLQCSTHPGLLLVGPKVSGNAT